MILDANGADTLRGSYRHLRSTGRLVVYGFHTMLSRGSDRPNYFKLLVQLLRTPSFHPLRMTNENKGVLAFNLSYLFDEMPLFHEAIADLLAGLERGELKPLPVTALPFEQVAEAHRLLHSGSTVGKIALVL